MTVQDTIHHHGLSYELPKLWDAFEGETQIRKRVRKRKLKYWSIAVGPIKEFVEENWPKLIGGAAAFKLFYFYVNRTLYPPGPVPYPLIGNLPGENSMVLRCRLTCGALESLIGNALYDCWHFFQISLRWTVVFTEPLRNGVQNTAMSSLYGSERSRGSS